MRSSHSRSARTLCGDGSLPGGVDSPSRWPFHPRDVAGEQPLDVLLDAVDFSGSCPTPLMFRIMASWAAALGTGLMILTRPELRRLERRLRRPRSDAAEECREGRAGVGCEPARSEPSTPPLCDRCVAERQGVGRTVVHRGPRVALYCAIGTRTRRVLPPDQPRPSTGHTATSGTFVCTRRQDRSSARP